MAWTTWLACAYLAVAQTASPNITVGTGITQPGGSVSVPITLTTNGASPVSLGLRIHFDTSRLQYVSLVQGAAIKTVDKVLSGNVPEPGVLYLVLWGVNRTALTNGVLGTITFSTPSDVPLGDYALTVSDNSMADADAVRISHTVTNGKVRVSETGEGEGEGEGEPSGGCFSATINGGTGAGPAPWALLCGTLGLAAMAFVRKQRPSARSNAPVIH